MERDVRQLANLRRLAAFETFVRLLAGRVGQVLNVNALSDDAGVSVPTVKEWLSVMEASYVIYVMRPYYRNFGKRFIKSPKVYFTETGLASYLLGIRSPEQVANHPLMGNLFENMAVMEILKRRLNRGDEPDMYFMRTSSGLEADIVVENGGRLDLYEVKASSTFRPDMTANLRRMAEFIPDVGRLALVYSGRASGIQDGVDTVNFADVGEV